MANIDMTPQGPERPGRPVHRAGTAVAGGSSAESLAGLAAVVLSILALIGVLRFWLAAIAAIVIGAGFLIAGSAIAARFDDLRRVMYPAGTELRQVRGGLSIETMGGIAGVALGILALLGLIPLTLLAIAAIVFGGVLLIGSGTTARLAELEAAQFYGEHPRSHEVEREAARGAAGAQVFVGIAAIVLGILALIGVVNLTLVLIAFLAVGGSMLLSGGALGARAGRVAH
jgi:hypothetical protein